MGVFKENYIKFLLYMVVIVLVNLAGLTLFFRADLTANKIFSLSDASKKAAATLSEPLSIKVFFSKNLPAPHNNTERYLKDLLDEYAARTGRLFNYQFYNVSSEEGDLSARAVENRKLAKSYGISPIQTRIMENDELKFQNVYMGMVLIHGDLIEKINAVTSTDGLEYRLTTAIQKLNNKVSALLRLEDTIEATLYLSSSLDDIAPLIGLNDLPELKKTVTKTIDGINAKSRNILSFNHQDITDKQALTDIGKKYDLMALSWPEMPENNIQAGQGAAGLVLTYQDQSASLPLITAVDMPIIGTTYQMADPETLEQDILDILEKMIGINQDIGYLADHGAPTLGPDRMAMQGGGGGGMQVFNDLLSNRYNIRQIALKDQTIPDGLNCLIIAKPTEPFSDYELFQIDQALMKGTNIAFFSDAFNEIMPRGGMGMPQYIPLDTGLEKLLAHYGITMTPAYVMDKAAYKHQPQEGGEQVIYFAPMLKEDTINNTLSFMHNIKGIIAMQASPVSLVPDSTASGNVTATRLLSSSKESWLMQGDINLNPMFISPPESDEEMDSYDLAWLMEGTFTSYFKDKPIPEKETGETDIENAEEAAADDTETAAPVETDPGGADPATPADSPEVIAENRMLESSRPAKIFVLGCSQMLMDNMLDPEGRTTNATFILNAIDHLNGNDEIAAMRSKQQTLNPLSDTSPMIRGVIKTLNIAGLPVLVFVFGVMVWAAGKARRKRIANQFKL